MSLGVSTVRAPAQPPGSATTTTGGARQEQKTAGNRVGAVFMAKAPEPAPAASGPITMASTVALARHCVVERSSVTIANEITALFRNEVQTAGRVRPEEIARQIRPNLERDLAALTLQKRNCYNSILTSIMGIFASIDQNATTHLRVIDWFRAGEPATVTTDIATSRFLQTKALTCADKVPANLLAYF